MTRTPALGLSERLEVQKGYIAEMGFVKGRKGQQKGGHDQSLPPSPRASLTQGLVRLEDPRPHTPLVSASPPLAPDYCPGLLQAADPAFNRKPATGGVTAAAAAFPLLGHRCCHGHRRSAHALLLPFPKAGLPGA